MADGGWQMADGRWRMADGGWQMADGRWRMADGEKAASLLPSAIRHPPSSRLRELHLRPRAQCANELPHVVDRDRRCLPGGDGLAQVAQRGDGARIEPGGGELADDLPRQRLRFDGRATREMRLDDIETGQTGLFDELPAQKLIAYGVQLRDAAFDIPFSHQHPPPRQLGPGNVKRRVQPGEKRDRFLEVFLRKRVIPQFDRRVTDVVVNARQRIEIAQGAGGLEKRHRRADCCTIITHAVKESTFLDSAKQESSPVTIFLEQWFASCEIGSRVVEPVRFLQSRRARELHGRAIGSEPGIRFEDLLGTTVRNERLVVTGDVAQRDAEVLPRAPAKLRLHGRRNHVHR
ncbi:MAG: hypothetical protein DMF56_21745 [Acidobacteria bacterium]|nr:MAG: hypothetical protein DMF56_21745 [Acidobacteriota bacterium]